MLRDLDFELRAGATRENVPPASCRVWEGVVRRPGRMPGALIMNALNTIFILALAFLAVFVESSFGAFRRVLGVQVDLLPGLMVYASLTSGITTVTLLSVLGGLWFDSLSANPLGV